MEFISRKFVISFEKRKISKTIEMLASKFEIIDIMGRPFKLKHQPRKCRKMPLMWIKESYTSIMLGHHFIEFEIKKDLPENQVREIYNLLKELIKENFKDKLVLFQYKDLPKIETPCLPFEDVENILI